MSSPETTSWIEPKHSFLSIEIFRHPFFLQSEASCKFCEAARPEGRETSVFSIKAEPDETENNEHYRDEVEFEDIRESDVHGVIFCSEDENSKNGRDPAWDAPGIPIQAPDPQGDNDPRPSLSKTVMFAHLFHERQYSQHDEGQC